MKLKNIFEEKTPDNKPKSDGFHDNIEKATLKNKDYRRVVFTSRHMQLVYMNIESGVEIGEEVHKVDQFIRVDGGMGESIINGKKRKFGNGDAIVVPAGAKHNVVNTGKEPLSLYTVYTPPQHKRDTVQKTKADEVEDHFDGKTDIDSKKISESDKQLYKANVADKQAVEMKYPNQYKNEDWSKKKVRREKVVVKDKKTGKVYGQRTILQKST